MVDRGVWGFGVYVYLEPGHEGFDFNRADNVISLAKVIIRQDQAAKIIRGFWSLSIRLWVTNQTLGNFEKLNLDLTS